MVNAIIQTHRSFFVYLRLIETPFLRQMCFFKSLLSFHLRQFLAFHIFHLFIYFVCGGGGGFVQAIKKIQVSRPKSKFRFSFKYIYKICTFSNTRYLFSELIFFRHLSWVSLNYNKIWYMNPHQNKEIKLIYSFCCFPSQAKTKCSKINKLYAVKSIMQTL